jgi:DNA-binding CsgD family transcriptional regulator
MSTKANIRVTNREIEVLKLSAEGYALKQIAALLNISADTAETHSRNLMAKLQAKNMKHAIAIGLRNRLIE